MSTEKIEPTTDYIPIHFTKYVDHGGAMVAIMGEFPARKALFVMNPEQQSDTAVQEILRAIILDHYVKENLSPKQKLGISFHEDPITLTDLPAGLTDRALELSARLMPEGEGMFEFHVGLPEFEVQP